MKTYQHPQVGQISFRKNARAKRIIMRVKPVEGVVVTLPKRVSYRKGLDFVEQNVDWIDQQKQALQSTTKDYTLGWDTAFAVREKTLRITPHTQHRASVTHTPKEITLGIPKEWDLQTATAQQQLRKIVVVALRKEGKQYLIPQTQYWANRHNISINKVKINKAKSRWGSCSSKKNINLSLFLMLLSDELIDYVIHHELAHIKHQNHSPAFWQHLEQLLPEAQQLDKQLRHCTIPF